MYEIGKIYPFIPKNIWVAEDDRKYLSLYREGEKKIDHIARSYDFQSEWIDKFSNVTEKKIIWCEVTRYDESRDLCYLEQCQLDLLTECYPGLPKKENFKVLKFMEEEACYLLKDAYGLEHHFYPQNGETFNLGDEVELYVEKIVERENRHATLSLLSSEPEKTEEEKKLEEIIKNEDPRKHSKYHYENESQEFKSSIVFTPNSLNPKIDEQIKTIMKSLAGFMNKNGGTLYIGVNDAGNVCGIEGDFQYLNSSTTDNYTYPLNKDGFENKIRSSIKRHLLNGRSLVDIEFETEGDKTHCIIKVKKSDIPIFFNGIHLYQRMGIQTNLLKDYEIIHFFQNYFGVNNVDTTSNEVEDTTEAEFSVPEINPESPVVKQQAEEEKKLAETIKPKIKRPTLAPWKNIYFYEDKHWSYGKKPVPGAPKLVREIPFPESNNGKDDNCLMVAYKNGHVASTLIKNVLSKNENQLYSNGWFNESEIVNAFVVNIHEPIAFRSQTDDGEHWYKIHFAGDISPQENLGAKGNKVVNDRLGGTITGAAIVPNEYRTHLDSYKVPKAKTSSFLGFKSSDDSFRNSIPLLDAIFE